MVILEKVLHKRTDFSYFHINPRYFFWENKQPQKNNNNNGVQIQSDLAFFGRLGGEKPRKMRKRKVRGYIYLMKWGRVSKNTEKCGVIYM